jgi:hypothetical protein
MLGLESKVEIGLQISPLVFADARQALNIYKITGGQTKSRPEDPILSGGLQNLTDPTEPGPGLADHKLTIEGPLCIAQFPYWLSAFMGSPTTSGSSPDYQHVYGSGGALNAISIQHRLQAGDYRRHLGCVGEELKVTLDPGSDGFGRFSMTFIGAEEQRGTTTAPGTVTAAPPLDRPAEALASLLWNAVAGGQIIGGEFTFKRKLKRIRAADATGRPNRIEYDGKSTLSGSVKLRYGGQSIISDAWSRTERAMELNLFRTSVRGFRFQTGHALLDETPVGADGPDGIEIDIPLTAYQSGADSAFKITALSGVASPVLPVFVNAEALAVSNAMRAASGVEPSNARKAIIDAAITGWKAAGTWALKDCLYPLCAGFDAASMKINWKNPGAFDLLAVGAGAFVPNQGYTPDGVSSYLDSQWSPAANGVNWTQNSAHLLAIVKLDTVNTVADVGAQTSTVNRVRARTLSNGTVNLNSATGLTGSGATPASTYPLRAMAIRRDASNELFWRNGVQDGTGASASAALSTATFTIGKTNNLFSNRPVAGADWGGAYSDAQAAADDAVWLTLVNACQDLGFYFGTEMADSFAAHADGPPATTQTGQPYLLNGTHNSIAAVTSGRLVAVTPEAAVATYTQVQLSQPGRHIKARFSLSPYTTTGGAATMGFWAAPMDDDTGTGVQDSPCHLVIAPTSWSFDVWSGNVSTTVRSAFWDTPLLTDGTIYEAEVYLDRVAGIALVIVKQGDTVLLRSEFRHALIASVAGPIAFIEHFRSATTNSLPSFVDWSAA